MRSSLDARDRLPPWELMNHRHLVIQTVSLCGRYFGIRNVCITFGLITPVLTFSSINPRDVCAFTASLYLAQTLGFEC